MENSKMDLREYEQNKFAIAEILRSASACVPQQTNGLRERLQPLFARLAEDRFNLVVVGRFNRGKTSLMNAILATDRLPTGIVPLTSVITTVGYGSKERVVLKYRNSMLDRVIPIEALPQHVTQKVILATFSASRRPKSNCLPKFFAVDSTLSIHRAWVRSSWKIRSQQKPSSLKPTHSF